MTSTGSDRESRLARLLGALLCAVVLVGGAAVADRAAASRVPVTSSTLMASSWATGTITSSFTHASGTSLGTTVDACSQRWTVLPASPANAMAISTTQGVVATTTGVVTATVPVCGHSGVNAEVAGDLRASGNGTTTFGVLLHAAPGGRPATAAVYSSTTNTVQIQRISSTGTVSAWSPTAAASPGNGTRYLRLVYVDGIYTVFLNNLPVLSYTPTAGQRTEAEPNRSVGIVAINDTRTTFDNFQGYPR